MKLLCLLSALLLPVLAEEETSALVELTNGNLLFTAKTYKEVAKDNTGKNFLFCPVSLTVVLALTEAGAGGKTAQEMITGLNLPNNEAKIQEALKLVAPTLNVDKEYTLTSANKIYLKNGYKVKPQFKNIASQVFNAEINEINFTNSESAAAEINKWVLDKTHNKIHDLVAKEDLDQFTRAVLINALYFYGLWMKPFYVESTSEKPFKVSTTHETKVNMMEQTDKFDYYEDATLKAKFLSMQYYYSPISMIFVLPNDIDGLPALEKDIEKILQITEFTYEEVHVQIPHMNVEHKIDFIPILQKFGVNDAFRDTANFSRLLDNTEPLVISKIVQKSFIAVEEKGTTAAAATEVLAPLGISAFVDPAPPKEFEANHPFIFILKSDIGVLFVGRYVDPSN